MACSSSFFFVFFLQVAQTIEVMSTAHPGSHERMLNSYLLERTEERWVEMNEVAVLKLMNWNMSR